MAEPRFFSQSSQQAHQWPHKEMAFWMVQSWQPSPSLPSLAHLPHRVRCPLQVSRALNTSPLSRPCPQRSQAAGAVSGGLLLHKGDHTPSGPWGRREHRMHPGAQCSGHSVLLSPQPPQPRRRDWEHCPKLLRPGWPFILSFRSEARTPTPDPLSTGTVAALLLWTPVALAGEEGLPSPAVIH